MPNFPESTGFKLPGMGSKEIDTPGNFRKDQGVEDVGYCSNTESHMLPPGSSPLLKTSMIEHVVPEYYKTSYTKTNWPTKKKGASQEQPPASEGGGGEESTNNNPERESMTIQQAGEERRGATTFAPGTDKKAANKYISDAKAKILKANPDFTPDQVTQKYRSDHNIGQITKTPGKKITISGVDLEREDF